MKSLQLLNPGPVWESRFAPAQLVAKAICQLRTLATNRCHVRYQSHPETVPAPTRCGHPFNVSMLSDGNRKEKSSLFALGVISEPNKYVRATPWPNGLLMLATSPEFAERVLREERRGEAAIIVSYSKSAVHADTVLIKVNPNSEAMTLKEELAYRLNSVTQEASIHDSAAPANGR